MADVLFWPPFPNRNCLHDHLFRSIWHFLPYAGRIDRLIFPYSGDDYLLIDADQTLDMAKAFLGRDYDPAIADYAAKFRGKIKVVPHSGGVPIDGATKLHGLVVWNVSSASMNAVARQVTETTGCQVAWVDPEHVPQETIEIIRFALGLLGKDEIDAMLSQSVYRFSEHHKRWRGRPMSVFGNGPTLQQVVERTAAGAFDPGPTLRAVCNSTIGDQNALEALTPEIMFAGDPVQHGGASTYAGRFRADLAAALMADERRVFITQLGFVPYFQQAIPAGAHHRIVGVGNDRRREFNIDLTQAFFSAATANIFTMLVLPVAFTLSRQVDIYGCDGQAFAHATKPWGHANEGDYMSKMAVTHRLHPGFWNRNYAEELAAYYSDMDEIIAAAEHKGIRVRSLTPSYVPALAKRFSPNV
jgi:hypothetical protein